MAVILDARGAAPYTKCERPLYTSHFEFAPEDPECAFRFSISNPSITR